MYNYDVPTNDFPKNIFCRRKALLIASAAIIIAAVLFTFYAEFRTAKPDPCAKPDRSTWYPCYSAKVHAIAMAEGISAALNYADKVIGEGSRYTIMHLVMHTVGHDAYHLTHDLDRAFAYLPPEARTPEHYFDFDGYQHGVLMAFFEDRKDAVPLRALMRESCASYVAVMKPSALPDWYQRIGSEQCFHGVGHALMAARENDVMKSLSDCDALPQHWMRDLCAHGVFMENFYLYFPFYEPGEARPFAKGWTMRPLCAHVPEEYREACARFVGWTLAITEPGDFHNAFAECRLLPGSHRNACVAEAARHALPAFFRDDFPAMVSICEKETPDYLDTCLTNAAVGIRQGNAGRANKDKPFCDLVHQESRESCRQAASNMYGELSFF